MASVIIQLQSLQKKSEPFIEQNLYQLIFAVSVATLAIFAPMNLLMGTAAGVVLRYCITPHLKTVGNIITYPISLCTLVSAIASVITWIPAGQAGGLVFRLITPLTSIAVGNALFRGIRSPRV